MQVFIALLRFSEALATTCKSLHNEPYITTSTLNDLNPDELCHHPFMVNFDKFYWSYNTLRLMMHQAECAFQTKHNKQNILHVTVHVNLMIENAVLIQSGIMISVNLIIKDQ